jgi:hypothetical protein
LMLSPPTTIAGGMDGRTGFCFLSFLGLFINLLEFESAAFTRLCPFTRLYLLVATLIVCLFR